MNLRVYLVSVTLLGGPPDWADRVRCRSSRREAAVANLYLMEGMVGQ
ncbi:MAG: hypothetical protein M3506_07350 [Chloroflexota bacterium]|nr:hypothetical protein [Chloroflexota bacterium]